VLVRIERPVWRRFRKEFHSRAAAWVKAGGFAAITNGKGRLDVLLPQTDYGRLTVFARWALLSIDHDRTTVVADGPAKGLRTTRIRGDIATAVVDWCDRDAIHPGPTRVIELDCLECGACCHDGVILIDERDLARFKKNGRADLTRPAHVLRHRDGSIQFRLAQAEPPRSESGYPRYKTRCAQLCSDNTCAIYPIRPDNCRQFEVGSEACLAAREDTLGIRDGALDVLPT